MLIQSTASFAELLGGLLYIFGFIALLAILTVGLFLLLTHPFWSRKLNQGRKEGMRGWQLFVHVFA